MKQFISILIINQFNSGSWQIKALLYVGVYWHNNGNQVHLIQVEFIQVKPIWEAFNFYINLFKVSKPAWATSHFRDSQIFVRESVCDSEASFINS